MEKVIKGNLNITKGFSIFDFSKTQRTLFNFIRQFMRILIQRTTQAAITIENTEHARIGAGAVVLVGIEGRDTREDADYLAAKLVGLRIFDDAQGVMNLDIRQTGGELLIVSQFTLQGSTKKGNRPSYINAARPEQALELYEYFLHKTTELLDKPVASGVFGANMQVSLVNDGPVTIWIDSKLK